MLTTERRAALTAVRDGAVTARLINAPGSPFCYEPKEKQVALGFLERAKLIQRDGKSVELTERGRGVLSRTTA